MPLVDKWYDDGEHQELNVVSGVRCSKRKWGASIVNGNQYNGIVADAGSLCIVRGLQARGNRYVGFKGNANSRFIVDNCWAHQNWSDGFFTTTGGPSGTTGSICHRFLNEDNSLDDHFGQGWYIQDAVGVGHLGRRSIVRGHPGWQIQPFSPDPGEGLFERCVSVGGYYTIIYHSSFAGNLATDRCSFIHQNQALEGGVDGSGTPNYVASDLRLWSPNRARQWASGKTTYPGTIMEDHTSPGNFYRTATGGVTAGTAITNDGNVTWVPFSDMPLDMLLGYYWPTANAQNLGAYGPGPSLDASRNMWPDGMFAGRNGWSTPPLFPGDTELASTAAGHIYHVADLDLRIEGVTGANAADWNVSDYASVRLPASITTQNDWGVEHGEAEAFGLMENPIPGGSSGDRIQLTATPNGGFWDLSLIVDFAGTVMEWAATSVPTGPWGDFGLAGDGSQAQWLTIPIGSSPSYSAGGLDFSGATMRILSQR